MLCKRRFLLALFTSAILLGCGRNGSSETTSRGTIAVSLLTLENPFFKIIGNHLALEAKSRGFDTLVVSADKDMAKQANQVKDFIVKKVDAQTRSKTSINELLRD